MRTKFSRGREVLDPIMSEEEIDSTDHIFGLTPEELKLVTDVIYESVESSKTASEFITKVVESASSGTAGWNFIMGFACGKMVEGMNTAAGPSTIKRDMRRTASEKKQQTTDLAENLAEKLGYIG